MVEWVYRLEKDLRVKEEKVKPEIPVRSKVLSKEIDFNNWNDKERIIGIRGMYGINQFIERQSRGDILALAYYNDILACFAWCEFPIVRDAGYCLAKDEAYIYDGYAFENFRGKRIYTFIQQEIFEYVREINSGINYVITHVARWNKTALASDIKAGYINKGMELNVVVLGFHRKFFRKNER